MFYWYAVTIGLNFCYVFDARTVHFVSQIRSLNLTIIKRFFLFASLTKWYYHWAHVVFLVFVKRYSLIWPCKMPIEPKWCGATRNFWLTFVAIKTRKPSCCWQPAQCFTNSPSSTHFWTIPFAAYLRTSSEMSEAICGIQNWRCPVTLSYLLNRVQPAYLYNLLSYHQPSRSLRSSSHSVSLSF